ncbi:hypothetical protein [Kribbella sp. VKM Ac-2568]|uniref:hypothetical protein n=1 Tax=Kribbella sp. VKM Ac-2568 TaxID=2512219 RepID=UPI00104BD1C9|nr:hypothetical protein [Kribbella sp. VKM Ac-2568]TCM49050.1 hypothetical protein EV648_103319 [Kribbella sp. VKM Ac-2568]
MRWRGDLTVENVADLYVGNAFMAAVHDADQPLTSLELLVGALPSRDTDGTHCTLLADALGLASGALVNGTAEYFPSVRASSWAPAKAEVRVGVLQPVSGGGEVFARPSPPTP